MQCSAVGMAELYRQPQFYIHLHPLLTTICWHRASAIVKSWWVWWGDGNRNNNISLDLVSFLLNLSKYICGNYLFALCLQIKNSGKVYKFRPVLMLILNMSTETIFFISRCGCDDRKMFARTEKSILSEAKAWQKTGRWPSAYFHFAVLLLLWSWQNQADCSAVALTEKTGEPESDLDRCSCWWLCQACEESWAYLQMRGCNRHCWQGSRETWRMNVLCAVKQYYIITTEGFIQMQIGTRGCASVSNISHFYASKWLLLHNLQMYNFTCKNATQKILWSYQHVVLLQHYKRNGEQLTTSSGLDWCICSHVFKWGCGCDRGLGNDGDRRCASQRNGLGICIPLSLTPLRQSFQKSTHCRTRTIRGCVLYPLSVFFFHPWTQV